MASERAPRGELSRAVLVALMLCDIDSGSGYREALLECLVCESWPSRSARDQ